VKTEAFIADLDRAHAGRRRAPLACGAVLAAWAAIIALYWDTATAMAAIWARSETFAHGWVVLPVALWVAWRSRAEVSWEAARPWGGGLALLALAGLAWLAGALAAALSVQQVALVVMLQAAALAVLGPAVSRQLAFPLALLLFAAPVGEFLVPTLIDRTADFTVWALRATGIPVYREGPFFVIPSGSWSVVEGCSGIRYIVASLMAGLVYAHLAYRTALRKAVFVAAAIVVPLVANWLRAYLIVLVGHLSDNRLAAGIDHLVYGWLFFGVVMALMFAFGAAWREPPLAAATATPRAVRPSWLDARPWRSQGAAFALATAAVAVIAASWPVAARAVAAGVNAASPVLASLQSGDGVPGWRRVDLPAGQWRPHYAGHRALLHERYARGAGEEVSVFVAYYRAQAQGRELINSQNVVVHPSDPRWRVVSRARLALPWNGTAAHAAASEVAGADGRWLATEMYWIDGRITTSEYVAAALLVLARLTGRGDDAAAVLLYTPTAESSAPSKATLAQFAADAAPRIERVLEAARAP
jgi:exosortase A